MPTETFPRRRKSSVTRCEHSILKKTAADDKKELGLVWSLVVRLAAVWQSQTQESKCAFSFSWLGRIESDRAWLGSLPNGENQDCVRVFKSACVFACMSSVYICGERGEKEGDRRMAILLLYQAKNHTFFRQTVAGGLKGVAMDTLCRCPP